jgi:cell pole-organizing protein PopZ
MTDPTPAESSPEQSMEEILASIRQIISEDLASVAAAESQAAPESPRAQGDDDDVLILIERAPPEPSPFAPPGGQNADRPVDSHAAEPQPDEPDSREAEPGEGRRVALAPSAGTAVVAHETAAVVAASFERLAFVVENTPQPPPFAVSAAGVTLEDITREILTPVIKAWLDENLPAIVQARVDEEVERITRGRVR